MRAIALSKKQRHYVKLISLFSLVLFAFILCFYNLKKPTIAPWDEYTNFRVVYSTIESDNFPLLYKDGETFFEKPPLWYWLTILSTQLFGINIFSVRLISAISGFFLIMLIFYLGWKMFSFRAGIMAGFTICATRHLFVTHPQIFSTHTLRSADLDSLQLLFIMLSALGFWNLFRSINKNRKYFWLTTTGILSAFAFLTKGPFALLPGITYFTFQVLNRNTNSTIQPLKQFLIFIFSFLITTVPWHLFMYMKFGNEFLDNYLVYHIFQRGTLVLEGHGGNIFFYIELLFHKDLFFSGEILLMAIIYFVARYRQKTLKNFSLFHCLMSPLLLLLLISLIQTKLSWYVFPLYPFAALLIGKFFHDLTFTRQRVIGLITIAMFSLILILQISTNLVNVLELS